MKLSLKIFLYFGTFIILVILTFFSVNRFVIERSLGENAREELREMAKSVNAAAETMLDTAIRNYLRGVVEQNLVVLERLYRQQQAGALTEQQAKDTFQKYALEGSIGTSGYVVALRQDGSRIMLDIHPFLRGKDCATNQGCQDWIEKKDGYSEYDWQNPEDKTLRAKVSFIHYFAPWDWVVGATSYKDEFTQLVNIEDLRPLIESFKVLKRGYFYVVDGNYKLLIHPSKEGEGVYDIQNEAGHYIAEETLRHLDDFYYYDWGSPARGEEEEKFAYATKLESFNWYVVASGYVADIAAQIRHMMMLRYGLLTVIATILTLLTIFFSRSLTRPLNALISGLEAFSRDRKVFKMQFRNVVEVESVGRAIETLTQNLVNAEQENQQLLTQLDGIIDSMPSMLVGVDQQEKVILWNKKASEYTGLSRKDALQQPVSLVLNDFSESLKTVKQALETQQHFTTACQVLSENKAVSFFEVTLYPLPVGLQAAVIRIDDTTERVRMEATMLQSRKMEAIGQLAGGVAHDFNNLIAGIQNSTHMLERKFDDPEKAKKYLKIIKDASQRAAGLTLKLLAFSRKDAKVSSQVHVHDAIRETVGILRQSVDKSIKISLELRAKNDVVAGDLSQLQSIFMNMGINSSHAMPDGGMLVFRSSELQLTAAECEQRSLTITPGYYLQIEVEDSGAGIPQQICDKVFEPFFTTKEQGKGTGLGLSSAYGAIKQHNGDIQVSSEEGKGTLFTIFLPLSADQLPRQISAAGAVVPGEGSILLVEDEEILRITTKEMLEDMGYRVFLAENGREGIDLYRQLRTELDLVLLDMIMPEMGGRECLLKMREIDPTVRVVMVSGFSKRDDLHQVQSQGNVGFIAKPYDAATLSRIVAAALQ